MICGREKGGVALADRFVGRVACQEIPDPFDANRIIGFANREINEDLASAIDHVGIKKVKVRRHACPVSSTASPSTGITMETD